MVKILAIETATDACSVALSHGDTVVERFEIAPRQHTDLILPMIAQLLAEAELNVAGLDAIAFGAGPGSFTGVRIATSVTQGLALAHDVPVVPVSCLAMLSIGGAGAHQCDTVVPVMDARKQEIYSAVYRVDRNKGTATSLVPDWIGAAEALQLPMDTNYVVIGRGAETYRERLPAGVVEAGVVHSEPALPHARDALGVAAETLARNAALAPELAQPVYLRRAV